ncbi:probable rho-associated protein kinase 2 at C-terminar half [Coccomyxa sp. Obi]|nr:probable rho-associated protein kinase 2 at C-terminar half [Coccomyxa sp. Obi]
MGSRQVSDGGEPAVHSQATTKPSTRRTALRKVPDATEQQADPAACSRIADKLLNELGAKGALCTELQHKITALEERAVSDLVAKLMAQASYRASEDLRAQEKTAAEASEAQLRAEIARLRESLAAANARALSEMVEKIMARVCLRASEELREQDKEVAEAAIAQLRTKLAQMQRDNDQLQRESDQLQRHSGDVDANLQQSRSTVLRLMQKLKASTDEHQQMKVEHIQENAATMAELQGVRANYDALCQQYQNMHGQCSLEVNTLRQANASARARLAEAERKLHAATEEAAKARQQMQAMMDEAERIEQEAQQREQELKEKIEEQEEKIEELEEKIEEQASEVADSRAIAEEVAGDRDYYLRQLDARLVQFSKTPLRLLADCPFMEALGQGAQASVDLHEMDGSLVAVKKPTDDEDQHSLLLEEESLASMSHRAIPQPLSWLTMGDGKRALAIQAYPGGSLRDMLRPEQGSGRIPMRPSMEWGMARIAEGAEALQYVHSMGRVHQDIKPGNLMLDAEGQLVIIDWGTSFLTSETPRTWCGSLGYLRPQTAAFPARAGPEDDIRGLCAVALELATGESVPDLLDTQYQEILKHEQAKEMVGECCRKHGLVPFDYRDRVLMAEYLGLICIEEEQFESYIDQEGAPREYLRLLLRALSQPVGCGEEPMPTLQEILDTISSYLSSRA